MRMIFPRWVSEMTSWRAGSENAVLSSATKRYQPESVKKRRISPAIAGAPAMAGEIRRFFTDSGW